MTNTTIPVSYDVKSDLEDVKNDGETWNGLMLRLLEDEEVTKDVVREIVRQEVVPEALE